MLIEIGRAKIKDIDKLLRLADIFEREHYSEVTKNNPKIKGVLKRRGDWLDVMRKYLRSCIYSRNAVIHTARHKGKIIAYSILRIEKNIPVFKVKKRGYFSDLYVVKKYRGMGISSRLKNAGMKWFKKREIKYACIGVHWGNERARKIYERWGFTPRHIELVKKV